MLKIKDLTVKFPSRFGDFSAVEGVEMTIKPGEIHGLVAKAVQANPP
jgi:peptide/nickel transport system ATP-binding protein